MYMYKVIHPFYLFPYSILLSKIEVQSPTKNIIPLDIQLTSKKHSESWSHISRYNGKSINKEIKKMTHYMD